MNSYNSMKSIFKILRKVISLTLIAAFIGSSLYVPKAQAGEMVMPVMPKPGTMVNLSPVYTPAYLKGIVVHPDNALKFDFLVHKGDGNLDENQKKQEYNKLIKYFLASLTVPEKDQWVNLSPYEKNRIIKDDFGRTEMGRDLLGQDYLLKQITASLMYPESSLGKTFWDKIYERAYKEYGTTNIPVNTFNKVWIVPDEALVYENGNTAYVVKSHLKVMLEEDYLSLKKHSGISTVIPAKAGIQNMAHAVASKIIKEVILPEIEREVNEDKNFAMLRQVFSGMVLATWYKMALKESLLGKIYADKAKVQGVDQNPKNNEAIYHKYLAAFKKGVYNYIKEDIDKYTNEVIPRKYFAGGFVNEASKAMVTKQVPAYVIDKAMLDDQAETTMDRAMTELETAKRNRQAQSDRALVAPIYEDIDQMYSSLPGDIESKIMMTKLLGPRRTKAVMDLISAHEDIYKRMGLLNENYHNHLHSLYVLYGSLVLGTTKNPVTNTSLIEDRRDLIVTILAALLHDFDVRLKTVKTPEGKEVGTAALVDETLGVPPGSPRKGGQLRDLLGIGNFVYEIAATDWANYKNIVTENDKNIIRELFRILTEGYDPNEIYAEVEAMIRRTDFPSNAGIPDEYFRGLTAEVRSLMDAQIKYWVENKTNLKEKDWIALRREVRNRYKDILIGNVGTNKLWLERQRDIELNLLNSLMAVKAERRLQIYQLATRVELSDQSAPAWLAIPPLIKEITQRLGLEQNVTVEATFPKFYMPQLLPDRVLFRLKDLPLEYKINFIRNMEHFADYSTEFARIKLSGLSEPDKEEKLKNDFFSDLYRSKQNWDDIKDRVLAHLDLYGDNSKIEQQESQITAERVRWLSGGRLFRDYFTLQEIHAIAAAKGVMQLRDYGNHDLIIEKGAQDDWFYIVVSGTVRVVTASEGVGYVDQGPGSFLGEMATISREPRNADVRSIGETRVLRMEGARLRALMLRNPKFRNWLYQNVVPSRLRAYQRENPPSWAKEDIMMTLDRDGTGGWQNPDVTLEYRIPDYLDSKKVHELVISNLKKAKNQDAVRHIKMIVIADATRNAKTPLAFRYEDPVDQKDFLVLSSQLFNGKRAEFLDALNKELDKQTRTIDFAMTHQDEGSERLNMGEFDRRLKTREISSDTRFRVYLKESPNADELLQIAQRQGWMLGKDDQGQYLSVRSTGNPDSRDLERLLNFYVTKGVDATGRPVEEAFGVEKRFLAGFRTEPDLQRFPRNRLGQRRYSPIDAAMTRGGIDLNAANLDLQIKRDGRGVPLPVSQQDMAQLARIAGFVPRILEIKPASSLPFLSNAK